MGMTATFLPKPVSGVNGSGMHLNLSFSKGSKNVFHDAKGEEGISKAGWDTVSRILNHAQELSLILNPSVNAYRRLDPHYEAPNQIKVSAVDRGAMIRIPPPATSARPGWRSAPWGPTPTLTWPCSP